MGSAFWDAFAGTPSAMGSSWDAEKVCGVLEGKAVVRVVDVEKLHLLDDKKTSVVGQGKNEGGLDGLEEKMGKMGLGGSTSGATTGACPSAKVVCRPPIFTNLRGGER